MRTAFVAVVAVTGMVLAMAGCAQTGMFAAAHLSSTELGEGNFRIVATSVSGTADASYLFGFSYPLGGVSASVALARVRGTGMLYQEAMANLWENFEKSHGAVEGRRLSLVNVRFDSDHLNLLLYTSATVSIRADVVEFTTD